MSSQRYRTVVKRHHVRRREIQVVAAALVIALILGIGFYLGQRAAYSGMGIDLETYRAMEDALPVTALHYGELEEELEVVSTRNEVDRAALEMVRRELAEQKNHILDLEENLRFYRGMMAPEDVARGLVLRPVELIATQDENRFAYRIVAQQEARKHTLLRGSLVVTISGVAGGEELSFPLSALSEEVDEGKLLLRFRYFQAIEGEMVLPPGFEPRSILMVAQATAPQKAEVQERYPWALQERFTYVGK